MKFTQTLALIIGVFFNLNASAVPVKGHKILYSGPSAYATESVKRVSQMGGNVVDCAVAAALTLSVTTPYFASLGGGGFALVKMKTEVEALDFRETAPALAGPDFFKGDKPESSLTGGKAVGVPGIPAGLWALHEKYGKLNWNQLFDEALNLSENGFAVSGEWSDRTKGEAARFNPAARSAFLRKNGSPPRPGEILKQPNLARALREFRNRNVKSFYQGTVARDIAQGVAKAGGVMTAEDLKNYKVRWLTPLAREYNGYKVWLMPPPSSGGVVIATGLSLMDQLKLKEKPLLSVDELHLLAEIEKRAFRGRTLLGDPDFVKNPVTQLLSDSYIKELRDSVRMNKDVELKPLSETVFQEKPETTHLSVMDSEGHAVSMTITLNGNYGSALATDQFHIALNNEMDDFTTHPGEPNMYGLVQGSANSVQPGKRPLSSMSPTLVEKDGHIVMAIGAPGGPRIISGVLQVLYRILGQDMDTDLAIQTPRIHHQFLPNKLYIEPKRLSPEVVEALRNRRHDIEESWAAKVYVVRLKPDGTLEAAFDSRGEGAAGGI